MNQFAAFYKVQKSHTGVKLEVKLELLCKSMSPTQKES